MVRDPWPLVGAIVLSTMTWIDVPLAQEPSVPAEPLPAGSPGIVPEKIEPPPQAGQRDGEGDLTKELAPTGGVIKPPERVDPDMVEPPPDNGAAVTPIIPPPVPPPASSPE